jgi:acetylglutamate kinase
MSPPALSHTAATEVAAVINAYALIYRRQGGTSDAAGFLTDMAEPLVSALRRIALEWLRDETGSHLPPGEITALVEQALRATQSGDAGVRGVAT